MMESLTARRVWIQAVDGLDRFKLLLTISSHGKSESVSEILINFSWPGDNKYDDHSERKVFSYENQQSQSRYGRSGAPKRRYVEPQP